MLTYKAFKNRTIKPGSLLAHSNSFGMHFAPIMITKIDDHDSRYIVVEYIAMFSNLKPNISSGGFVWWRGTKGPLLLTNAVVVFSA